MSDNKKNLVDLIQHRIKEEHIVPDSRFKLNIKRIIIWIVIIIAGWIAAHSLGILLYFLNDFNFQLLSLYLDVKEKARILYMLLVWFSILVLGLGISFRFYRKTKYGYRLENLRLISFLFVAVSSIGYISYKSEITPALDRVFSQYMPAFQSWETTKVLLWSQPEKGLLFGKVEQINQLHITLVDAKGHRWNINLTEAHIRRRVNLEPGIYIKILGELLDNEFFAKEIRPWKGKYSQGRCRQANDFESCVKSRGQ